MSGTPHKDIDLEQNVVIIRSGKGDKDRRTALPKSLKEDLIRHIATVRTSYDKDREKDLNGVWLPGALEKKYPNAGKWKMVMTSGRFRNSWAIKT